MAVTTSLFLLVVTFVIALVLGAGFSFVPIKSKRHKPLLLVVFALIVSVGGLIFIFLFPSILYGSLNSLVWFQGFVEFFENVAVSIIKYNAPIVATVIILAVGEIGLGLGFGIVSAVSNRRQRRNLVSEAVIGSVAEAGNLANLIITKNYEGVEDQNLRRDEQSVMELFLYGKVCEIMPKITPGAPEGYLYEGIPQLDWDTKHSRQVLDALVRKGYLHAELVDKVIVCQICGSGNIRVTKTCSECGSFWLQKGTLLEHFSCSAVEQKSAFETQSGELLCPKCSAKLASGGDYRVLPSGYVCLSCKAITQEPRFNIKCNDCTSVAEIIDEPEILLCKYTANVQMPLSEFHRIKPLDTCVQFFKSIGYTIVVPAFISGRSGIQHLFDILILGKVNWTEFPKTDAQPHSKSTNGNTLVEVLLSTQPLEVEELTRIFGKTSDIDCDFILFVIPCLTPDARSYARTHGIKVSEGKNIEDALSNSNITCNNNDIKQ